MRENARAALSRLRNPRSSVELEPYLADAEAFLEAGMAQIARRSGQECGPIEASILVQGSLNHAYSLFYWALAGEDMANAKVVLMASKLGEAAKACLSKALEMAVAIARGTPRAPSDPLAAYDVPPEPEPE
jgi:hypothetical protein